MPGRVLPVLQRSFSESGSNRGSRVSTAVFDSDASVDAAFLQVESCRMAEERHWVEMKGWKPGPNETLHSLRIVRIFMKSECFLYANTSPSNVPLTSPSSFICVVFIFIIGNGFFIHRELSTQLSYI